MILGRYLMPNEKKLLSNIHPAIAAMEKANDTMVVLKGFIGKETESVVRLYPAASADKEIIRHF
jgi:hypothetical protein